MTEDNVEMANIFNKHFANVGIKLAQSLPTAAGTNFVEEKVDDSIFLKPTDVAEIRTIA